MKHQLKKTAMLIVVLALIGCENSRRGIDTSTFEKVYVETHANVDGSIPRGKMRIIEITLIHSDSGGPCCVAQRPDGSKMYYHGPASSLDGLHVGMIIDDDVLQITPQTKTKVSKKAVKKKIKSKEKSAVTELGKAFGSYWDWMKGRADKVESRLDSIEAQLGKFNKAQDEMDARLDDIDKKLKLLIEKRIKK